MQHSERLRGKKKIISFLHCRNLNSSFTFVQTFMVSKINVHFSAGTSLFMGHVWTNTRGNRVGNLCALVLWHDWRVMMGGWVVFKTVGSLPACQPCCPAAARIHLQTRLIVLDISSLLRVYLSSERARLPSDANHLPTDADGILPGEGGPRSCDRGRTHVWSGRSSMAAAGIDSVDRTNANRKAPRV